MEPSLTSESPTVRFASYTEEIREFLQSRKLATGHPGDLEAFEEQLGHDAVFHDEMVSLVRSVVFREGGTLPGPEITRLLTLATAGPTADETSKNEPKALRTVSAFATEIVRSFRGKAASDLNTFNEAEEAIEASIPVNGLETPLSGNLADSPETDSFETMPEPGVLPNDRLAKALSQGIVAAQGLPHVEDPGEVDPEVAAPTPKPQSRTSLGSLLQRWYWVPGACLMLAAIGTSMTLLRKPTGPLAARVVSLPSSALPKPSAYGPALASNKRQRRSLTAPQVDASDPGNQLSDRFAMGAGSHAMATTPGAPSDAPAGSALSAGPARRFVPPYRQPATTLSDAREGVFLASSGAMAGHLQFAPAPSYPKLANFAHVQGQVLLQVVVSRDGSVAATHVLQGHHLLRSAAEHAVRQWRYRPYVVDGRPTDVATLVTVTFRLRD